MTLDVLARPGPRPLDLRLYLVSDTLMTAQHGLISTIRAAVAGGATVVQLRDPDASDDEFVALGRLVRVSLQNSGVPLIINDRVHLVEEIGVEPGADLADMERQVLAHDPTLRATPAGARSSTVSVPVGRARRQVTVVCCAATGVEAMAAGRDPATVVRMMDHFRRVAAAVFGRHGGVVVASASALTLAAYFGLGTDEPEAAVVAQFAPVFFGGLIWRRATARGALAGVFAGGDDVNGADLVVPDETLAEIVESGRYHVTVGDRLRSLARDTMGGDPERCRAAGEHGAQFRERLSALLRGHRLDAVVYPTWSNAPRLIGDLSSPHGDNNQVLAPRSGFPAITVPMGYTYGTLPAGLQFLGDAWSEARLIALAYAYEQATRHRAPPASTPPLR